MDRRHWFLVPLLMAGLPSPAAAEHLDPNSATSGWVLNLDVGAGSSGAFEDTSDLSLSVWNSGGATIAISGVSVSPTSGNPYLQCIASCGATNLGSQSVYSFTVRARASDQAGDSGGKYINTAATATVNSDHGNITFSITISVKDWAQANYNPGSGVSQSKTLACGKPVGGTTHDFSLSFANTGDYLLSLNTITFPNWGSGISVTPLSGSTTVPARSSITRDYRFNIGSEVPETTYSGTIFVSTSAGSGSTPLSLTITHPVTVTLTPSGGTHDFGAVELLRTSPEFRIVAQETCRYKAASVALDQAQAPPGFVQTVPTSATIPPGQTASIAISTKFTTAHAALINTPQSWSMDLVTTTGRATYTFEATPSFIGCRDLQAELRDLAGGARLQQGRQAAQLFLDLTTESCQPCDPCSTERIADAQINLALADPIILSVRKFDSMRQDVDAGRVDDVLSDLVALATGYPHLKERCAELSADAAQTKCDLTLTIVREVLDDFADEAKAHFEQLAASSTNSLDQIRAFSGLAASFTALENQGRADELSAAAEAEFDVFASRVAKAQELVEGIDVEEDDSTPWRFAKVGDEYVAWHPLSLAFLNGFEEESLADLRAARAELQAAGDQGRLQEVDARIDEFEATMAASLWTNRLILGGYLGLLGFLAYHFGTAAIRWRKVRVHAGLGEFILPEEQPAVAWQPGR